MTACEGGGGVKGANAMHLHSWVDAGAPAGNLGGRAAFGQDTALSFGPAEFEDLKEWSPACIRELSVGVVGREGRILSSVSVGR